MSQSLFLLLLLFWVIYLNLMVAIERSTPTLLYRYSLVTLSEMASPKTTMQLEKDSLGQLQDTLDFWTTEQAVYVLLLMSMVSVYFL